MYLPRTAAEARKSPGRDGAPLRISVTAESRSSRLLRAFWRPLTNRPRNEILATTWSLVSNLSLRSRVSRGDFRVSPVLGSFAVILLTGATGRIGKVVIDDLLNRDYEVRAKLEWFQFDFETRRDHDSLVSKCSCRKNSFGTTDAPRESRLLDPRRARSGLR